MICEVVFSYFRSGRFQLLEWFDHRNYVFNPLMYIIQKWSDTFFEVCLTIWDAMH